MNNWMDGDFKPQQDYSIDLVSSATDSGKFRYIRILNYK